MNREQFRAAHGPCTWRTLTTKEPIEITDGEINIAHVVAENLRDKADVYLSLYIDDGVIWRTRIEPGGQKSFSFAGRVVPAKKSIRVNSLRGKDPRVSVTLICSG